jgi:dihydroflavonol-4-reductase
MRVLVTGATGYLGGHVVARLLARGADVRALVRPGSATEWLSAQRVELHPGDLLDERSLREACRGRDSLVHCAGRTGYWSRQDEIQRRVNVEGTSSLLRTAHKAKMGRIVHVSSVAAVGCNRSGEVLDESSSWIGARGPRMNYVLTKRESEERALAAVRQGMPTVVVNPGALIGPRIDGGPPRGMVARAASGTVRRVPRIGITVCEVSDVAEGIALALEKGRIGERYILGGHNIRMLELYQGLAACVGVKPPRGEYSPALGALLAAGATALDLLRLSRPRWAPELFRAWGWYAWVDSAKAVRELGYRMLPLPEMLERATAFRRAESSHR